MVQFPWSRARNKALKPPPPAPDGTTNVAWHAIPVEEVLQHADTKMTGLTSAQVAQRTATYGRNQLTPPYRPGLLIMFWNQINNILMYILIISAIISAIFEDWADFALIIAVIVLNVIIGVIQEGRAEAAAEAIKAMLAPQAVAVRDGQRQTVDALDLVPGDVVFIVGGDRIAADVRIVEASNLKVNESALTGESKDVEKTTEAVEAESALGDRVCMGYASTYVTAGSGVGIVVNTGDYAEIGKINALMTSEEDTETPLLGQIETFGRWLSLMTIIVAVGTFFIAWKARTHPIGEAFEIAVSIAVAIIPEGLPSVVTITLALGVQHMAAKRAIVRQLPAVETLGAVSVICSDKTGTLTKNEMTVTQVYTMSGKYGVTGAGYSPGGILTAPGVEQELDADRREKIARLLLPGLLTNDSSLVPKSRAEMEAERAAKAKAPVGGQQKSAAAAVGTVAPTAHNEPTGTTAAAQPTNGTTAAQPTNGTTAAQATNGTTAAAAPGSSSAAGAAAPSEVAIAVNGSDAGATAKPRRTMNDLLADPDTVWTITGDPTEGALLPLAMKAGVTSIEETQASMPRIATIPFESDYKMMATLHDITEKDGKRHRVMLVKGAWDQVIQRSSTQAIDDDPAHTVPCAQQEWLAACRSFASNGLRVLAFAQKEFPPDKTALMVEDLVEANDLEMLCLVAIVDPPRPEVRDAIVECKTAGITVKMITGDHADTAKYIANSLGIDSEEVLTGLEVARMSEAELKQHVLRCSVYARASPENKIQIVKALRSHGKIVSMTGDGVNDAPSLKAASVGVAMGITGTEVAKQAAKIILADDNFTTIKEAVKEGRTVYDNLRKVILFALPTNFAQGFSIVMAMIIGMQSPLTAVQTLTVNMVTSVTLGIVLALEKAEPDVMERPPRDPDVPLLDAFILWRTFYVTVLLVAAMLGNLQWQLAIGGTPDQGRAAAMGTLVIAQCLYALSCRQVFNFALNPRTFFTNPWVLYMIVLNAAIQCFLNYTPKVRDAWDMAPINGLVWLRILMFAFVIFFIVEIEKFIGPRWLYPAMAPIGRAFNKCCKRSSKNDPLAGIVPVSASMTGLTSKRNLNIPRAPDAPVSPQALLAMDIARRNMSTRSLGKDAYDGAPPAAMGIQMIRASRRNLTIANAAVVSHAGPGTHPEQHVAVHVSPQSPPAASAAPHPISHPPALAAVQEETPRTVAQS